MQKGLGIAAFVLSIICIFIPAIGAYATAPIAILAVFAYGEGISFGVSAIVINLVNILVLSPSLLVGLAVKDKLLEDGVDVASYIQTLCWIQIIASMALYLLHRSHNKKQQKIQSVPQGNGDQL